MYGRVIPAGFYLLFRIGTEVYALFKSVSLMATARQMTYQLSRPAPKI